MDISIKDLGACRKELAVVVPADEVAAELSKAFEGVRDQVSIPGFRQGRVPRTLIEKRFGREVRADVTSELVGKAVEQALKEHRLELVSEPEIQSPPEPPEEGGTLEFSFVVEVKPEFDLPEYKGLEVARRVEPVKDSDVDAVLEDLRRHHGVLEPVTDGAGFVAGDWLLADARVYKGEELVETMQVPLGGNRPRVRGYDVQRIEEALPGKKPGDAFTVEAVARARPPHAHEHGDEHHHHEHEHEHDEPPVQPGDQVRIDLAVSELKRQRLPELDDAFAREVGEETFLGLRVAVRKRLEAARERQADAMVETKLLDQIVDRASFEMARGPVDRAVASRIDRVALERMIHGEDEESARAAAEAGRDEIRRIVERDARAWLIVEKVAKKEKIFAFEDDVAKEIARIAAERGATPTKVREVYESEGMIPELRANILERKVLDFLREHGRVVDAKEEAAAGSGAGDQGA